MNNQQVPKADSKFQKIVKANHKKWKIKLLSKGGQKANSGGSPYQEKPDYKMGKSAPSLFIEEQLNEIITKRDGKFCLVSKKKNKEGKRKNLGCYSSREDAEEREKQVQYFKHIKEQVVKSILELLEEEKKSKNDRCIRIAKRKYKTWPSAYASGAVVKCRQGKIWKNVKE